MKEVQETIKSLLPVTIEIDNNVNLWVMKDWCNENIGLQLFADKKEQSGYDYQENGCWDFLIGQSMIFHFRNQDDAVLFKLAWGGPLE